MKNNFLIKKFWNPKIKFKSIYFLSNKCNRNCKFCYFDYKKYLKPSMIQYEALKNYKPDLVYFSGGEPFVSSKIWDYFFNLNIYVKRITIFTNGDFLDWEIIEKLSKYTDKVLLIINNGKKLFKTKIKNCEVWNKIFINDKFYTKLLDKTVNENILLSYQVPSFYSKNEFSPSYDINWNEFDDFIKNYKGNLTVFEPIKLSEKSKSWYKPFDLFDHYVFFPFAKQYKMQIGSCLKCNAYKNLERCYDKIQKNKCSRISKKCFNCKYNHICLIPQSRFRIVDVDKLDCERSLKPLFNKFLKYGRI